MKCIDEHIIKNLQHQAIASPRKRSHYTLHEDLKDSIQRVCVVIRKGSYVQPHRHSKSGVWELFIVLEGKAVVLLFNDHGTVTERIVLSSSGSTQAIEIPENTWHTLCALEETNTLLEIKPGPYIPPSDHDRPSWAPKEGLPSVAVYEKRMKTACVGMKLL